MVREKQILQDQGKVREIYLESGKIDILKKSQGRLKWFNADDLIPSLASKRERVMPKDALTGCKTWHDWSSNVWRLVDRNVTFRVQNVHHQQIRAKPIYFHGYTRSKTTFAKGVCILTQVRVSCAELLARKLAPRSAKLQMFDDQSCHVWHPIRACFGVTCSRLDASDGTWKKTFGITVISNDIFP